MNWLNKILHENASCLNLIHFILMKKQNQTSLTIFIL